jgi:hypothetical protein
MPVMFSSCSRRKWKAVRLHLSNERIADNTHDSFVWRNSNGSVSNVNRHIENYHPDIYAEATGEEVQPRITAELPPLDLEKFINKMIIWIITEDQVGLTCLFEMILTLHRHYV